MMRGLEQLSYEDRLSELREEKTLGKPQSGLSVPTGHPTGKMGTLYQGMQ